MLNSSFFDGCTITFRNRVLCVVCSVLCVTHSNIKKRYKGGKKIKISLEVPSNQIFSKTDSYRFALKSINNFVKETVVKTVFFGVLPFFSSENGYYTLHTTHYTLHTLVKNGV